MKRLAGKIPAATWHPLVLALVLLLWSAGCRQEPDESARRADKERPEQQSKRNSGAKAAPADDDEKPDRQEQPQQPETGDPTDPGPGYPERFAHTPGMGGYPEDEMGAPEQPPQTDFQQKPDTPAGQQPKDRMWLWEGFETPGRWAVDAADDPAEISLSEEKHTEGYRSLEVEFSFVRKGKVLITKETRLNLEGLKRFLVDVYAPADGLGYSVAFKSSAGSVWYESNMQELKKGWNRDVSVRLSEADFRAITAKRIDAGFVERLDDVRQVFLILHKGGTSLVQETAWVDNVRFWGTPAPDWNLTEPKIVKIFQPTTKVGQWKRFEVGVRIDGSFANMFDAKDIAVDAVFAGPGDKRLTIPAFFAGYAEDEENEKTNGPIWLVRFAPPLAGRWEFNIVATNKLGQSISDTRWFFCEQSEAKGYVQVSPKDHRYFEFGNGDFFRPHGQNVAWASDFEFYFKRQAETGQNWVRIWLCPWSLWLEPKHAGVYDLKVAAQIDRIVELAEKYGLYIQLCFEYHGMLNQESWGKNPYNTERGGPCATPAEFFTNAAAQRLFKQRLRYIAARWGYSRHIFSWELFNEVDLTNYATDYSLYHWHRTMSQYLKQVDAGRHMVTTSFYNDEYFRNVWRLGAIDFTQRHLYTKDIVRAMIKSYELHKQFNKPYFVGEFGGGATAEIDMKDVKGEVLHDGLWTMAVLPAGGLAGPWWWDKQIQPNKLERRFEPVADFLKGSDPRGKAFRVIDQTIRFGGISVNVLGRISSSEAYLWLYDVDPEPKHLRDEEDVLVPANSRLALANLLSGGYEVTYFNTDTGKVLGDEKITTQSGTVVLSLPESQADLAIRLRFQGDSRPHIVPTIDAGDRTGSAGE